MTDASGVLECLKTAFEPYRAKYTPDAFADTILTPETIQGRLRQMSVFVAVTPDNQIIGTIACSVINVGEGHLRGMAVLPEWHGRGVAETLLQSAEAELAARGCSRITLDTTVPLQRAIRVYEKQGFTVCAEAMNWRSGAQGELEAVDRQRIAA